VALAAVAALLIAGCGSGEEEPDDLHGGAGLASRLPTDDALNIAIVDLAAVRRSLGMPPHAAPPTGEQDVDQTFLSETGPALGMLQGGMIPNLIEDALVRDADTVASVSGDKAVTAISTTAGPGSMSDLMRSNGLEEQDDDVWVAADGSYAIAFGPGVVGLAESPGDARSVVERTDGKIPKALAEIQRDGQLVTLARFGASCVESIGTSDSIHRPGEVSFFTSATPDASRIVTKDEPASEPRVVGDSARVTLHAADRPGGEPPALKALEAERVDYDCDG
jgi:hypothetical protein